MQITAPALPFIEMYLVDFRYHFWHRSRTRHEHNFWFYPLLFTEYKFPCATMSIKFAHIFTKTFRNRISKSRKQLWIIHVYKRKKKREKNSSEAHKMRTYFHAASDSLWLRNDWLQNHNIIEHWWKVVCSILHTFLPGSGCFRCCFCVGFGNKKMHKSFQNTTFPDAIYAKCLYITVHVHRYIQCSQWKIERKKLKSATLGSECLWYFT